MTEVLRTACLVLALAPCAACSTTSSTPDASPQPPNCAYIDASACVGTSPSYATDIAPMLDRACNSTCHAPGVGPWPLNNYSDVNDWASIIANDLERCSMPPIDAGAGNGTLTDAERAMLLNWIACGPLDN